MWETDLLSALGSLQTEDSCSNAESKPGSIISSSEMFVLWPEMWAAARAGLQMMPWRSVGSVREVDPGTPSKLTSCGWIAWSTDVFLAYFLAFLTAVKK